MAKKMSMVDSESTTDIVFANGRFSGVNTESSIGREDVNGGL